MLSDTQTRNWKRWRKRGRLSWVVRRGALGWGLPAFALFTGLLFLVDRSQISWRWVLIGIPVWMLGGVLFGVLTWSYFERQYRAGSCAEE